MPLQITVLGLDTLGTSLGLALGTLDPKILDVGRPRVTGWDETKKTLENARGRLAIDVAAPDLASAVAEADVVFVNVAEAKITELFAAIAPHLKSGVIVTDLASVKAPVMRWAKDYLPHTAEFIGGHPFVTMHTPNQPKIDIFRNAIYCLVPEATTSTRAINGMTALVTAIGAKPYFVDAEEHDAYAAGAAHLPLLVAISLMDSVSKSGSWREIQPIAGEGLVTTTTLAEGDPTLAAAALHANRAALRTWISTLQNSLAELQQALDQPAALEQIATRAAEARQSWLSSTPDLRPGEAELAGNIGDVHRTNLSGMFFGRRPFRPKK